MDSDRIAIPIITDGQGKYLLVTRKEYPQFKNHWGPIGGHIMKGEKVEDALIREAKEELNLDIKPFKKIDESELDIPGKTGLWWECEIVGGEISINEEIEKYGYFSKEEIGKMKLWPATKKFFDKFT